MRHLSLLASAVAVGTGVIYIGFLVKQGSPVAPLTVVVVTGAIAALAALTAYGSLGQDPTRRALALWAAVPGFFGLGYLAAFSIGGLLLIGGLLSLPAAITALRGITSDRRAVAGWFAFILAAWAVVIAVLLIGASWLATP
ncbi:MAG: hypothetical protein ACRDFZ_01030 [Candidatus Limnocylindria bacterium]